MLASNAPPVTFLLGTVLSRGAMDAVERRFAAVLLCLVLAHVCASLAFPLRRVLPAALRQRHDATAVARALLLEWAANLVFTPLLFCAFMWRPELRAANCPAAQGLGGCGLAYVATLNLSRTFRTVVAQVPPRLAFAPEVARGIVNAICCLMAHALDGALTPLTAAASLGGSAGALAFSLTLISLHHDAAFADAAYLPPWLDLWPRRWHPAREAVLERLAALAARCAPLLSLDHRAMCGLNMLAYALAGVLSGAQRSPLTTLGLSGRLVLRIYLTLTLVAAASSALSGGGSAGVGGMARRLGLDPEASLVDEVQHAVTTALSEEGALRSAAEALRVRLFPRARALALRISLAGDETPITVTLGGPDPTELMADGSRAFVVSQNRCLIADSRDFPAGLATFADWTLWGASGAEVVITAPLPAGPALLGTLVVTFAAAAPTHYEEVLMRCCRAIGEGLFARREAATSTAVNALACDAFPEHVLARLLERSRRASAGNGGRPSLSLSRGARASSPAAAPLTPPLALRPPSPLAEPVAGEDDDNAPQRDPAAAMRRRISTRLSLTASADNSGCDLFYSESHECVSVIFIDLCDFTPLAEAQDALATMQMLHALYCRFDELCESLGVYKVETVGDQYMAAAGLTPGGGKADGACRHAAAAALFALRAHSAAAACGLRVRSGVHSGPVTSGLVGRLRARFCLFGDTVNTVRAPEMDIAARLRLVDQRAISILQLAGFEAGGCRYSRLRAAVARHVAPGGPARRAEPRGAEAAAQGQGGCTRRLPAARRWTRGGARRRRPRGAPAAVRRLD